MDSDDKCMQSYLSVTENVNGELEELGMFCGEESSPETPIGKVVISSGDTIYLSIASDNRGQIKPGFTLQYSIATTKDIEAAEKRAQCGSTVTAGVSPQLLTSPGFGAAGYKNNIECEWHIASDEAIVLDFMYFNLEYEEYCIHDWVEIEIENSEAESFSHRFCGREDEHVTVPDRLYYSYSGYIIIRLHTDSTYRASGFQAEYRKATPDDHIYVSDVCGGYLTATNQLQSFASPGYNIGLGYPADTECTWTIKSYNHQPIIFNFEQFDLEGLKDGVCQDTVQITDVDSPMSDNLGRYCGTMSQPAGDEMTEITSTSNEILIHMSADARVTHHRGFHATYKTGILVKTRLENGTTFLRSLPQVI